MITRYTFLLILNKLVNSFRRYKFKGVLNIRRILILLLLLFPFIFMIGFVKNIWNNPIANSNHLVNIFELAVKKARIISNFTNSSENYSNILLDLQLPKGINWNKYIIKAQIYENNINFSNDINFSKIITLNLKNINDFFSPIAISECNFINLSNNNYLTNNYIQVNKLLNNLIFYFKFELIKNGNLICKVNSNLSFLSKTYKNKDGAIKYLHYLLENPIYDLGLLWSCNRNIKDTLFNIATSNSYSGFKIMGYKFLSDLDLNLQSITYIPKNTTYGLVTNAFSFPTFILTAKSMNTIYFTNWTNNSWNSKQSVLLANSTFSMVLPISLLTNSFTFSNLDGVAITSYRNLVINSNGESVLNFSYTPTENSSHYATFNIFNFEVKNIYNEPIINTVFQFPNFSCISLNYKNTTFNDITFIPLFRIL